MGGVRGWRELDGVHMYVSTCADPSEVWGCANSWCEGKVWALGQMGWQPVAGCLKPAAGQTASL